MTLLVNTTEAARMVGYSRAAFYRVAKADRALAVCRKSRPGRRAMWSTAALVAWVGAPKAAKASRVDAVLTELSS